MAEKTSIVVVPEFRPRYNGGVHPEPYSAAMSKMVLEAALMDSKKQKHGCAGEATNVGPSSDEGRRAASRAPGSTRKSSNAAVRVMVAGCGDRHTVSRYRMTPTLTVCQTVATVHGRGLRRQTHSIAVPYDARPHCLSNCCYCTWPRVAETDTQYRGTV
ncbi:hypothetical protein J6590_022656 [Homalodisca vitripennis]|nr:hypothetical protein J6590_022656 [Homalodisca vitripennis]